MPPNANTQSELSESVLTKRSNSDKDKSKQELQIADDQIRIQDKLYDAEKLLNFHPGGPLFISAFAGRDASQAFLSYHRKKFPHKRMQFALDATDPNVVVGDDDLNKDFLELCRRVEKALPGGDAFAPWSYYIKAIFILGTSIALEGYMHYTGEYRWHMCAVLGLFWALIGLNVSHDATHGSLSRNPRVNRFWQVGQYWNGASVTSWIHQHVVQHHIHTNDVHLDPDIEGKYVMRLNPLAPLMKFHAMQWLYFFFLINLYGYSIVKFSFTTVLEGFYYTPFSKMLNRYRYIEFAWSLFFYTRWFVIPYVQQPSIYTFLNTAPMFMVFGFYLSVFFHISHNFEGVQQLQETAPNKSWLYNQVIVSSNVCGWKLGILNGGLNFQIEHHLFPRMHHGHYATVSPIVREFCEEKGIPYRHFDSIWDNLVACVKHMYDFGTNPVPKAANELEDVLNHHVKSN